MKEFQPDYTNLVESAKNREVKRTPLYEHSVGYGVIETITGKKLDFGDAKSLYTDYCNFFKNMGYDTVSFECGVVDILLEGGRLTGHRDPIITSVEELDKYPFEENIERFKKAYYPIMKTLIGCLPDGMKLVGGVGYGVFEVVQDLVGYENLCLIKYDDPTLYRLLFQRVGDMMFAIWKDFLKNFADGYCVLRFGDDLGYKSNTMLPKDDIIENILPQYKRIVDEVHSYGKPFLLHSCGCLFDVMPDIIARVGIDAKHSNEDDIAPFRKWVDLFGDKIGNFGGMDTDNLVRMDTAAIAEKVGDIYRYCSKGHGGFAFGSGNSVPDYVDAEKYMTMVETHRKLRGDFER